MELRNPENRLPYKQYYDRLQTMIDTMDETKWEITMEQAHTVHLAEMFQNSKCNTWKSYYNEI